MQETQGESFMIFMRFLGIIPLLDILRKDLKYQWISLWCQTRIPLSSFPQRSLVNYILAMYSLISSSPITSFPTSSRLVEIWYGLSVGVRRPSPASRLFFAQNPDFQVYPQVASLVRSSRVVNLGGSDPFWCLTLSFGDS